MWELITSLEHSILFSKYLNTKQVDMCIQNLK